MAGAKVDDGPLVTQAYVVSEQGGKLELKDITLPPLKPTQVRPNRACSCAHLPPFRLYICNCKPLIPFSKR
jgi:hypothetical protein